MTQEQFKKAEELKKRIENLCVLSNSIGIFTNSQFPINADDAYDIKNAIEKKIISLKDEFKKI